MATDLGSDFSCVEDLSFDLSTVSGRLCVAHAVARRLQTPANGGLWYDQNYGRDLRQYLNAPVQNPRALESGVVDEALKDERVEPAGTTAAVTVSGNPQKLTTDINVDTSDGPFELVLAVSALTVELISFNEI